MSLRTFCDIKPDESGISDSLTMGHLLVHVFTNQITKQLETLQTHWPATLNADSLLTESLSVNQLAWSKCFFYCDLTPLILIPIHVLWISICINYKTQVVLLNYSLPHHGSHFIPHLRGLMKFESSYEYKSKKDSRGSYLGESTFSCMATDPGKTIRLQQETEELILSDGSGQPGFHALKW